MADAEIIPIGTKAAAGRGSRTSPSAAARALATGARSTAEPGSRVVKKQKKAARSSATAKRATAASTTTPSAGTTTRKRAVAKRATPEPRKATAPRAAAQRSTAARPSPADALEAERLVEEVTDAAKEVYGESGWERRLAEGMAFLRHRITGDYEVDEFGFDPEITERFILTALRPLAERWFRIEVRGIDNIPAEGGALLVSNHSGTIPIDGLMTSLIVHDHADRWLRSLGANLVFTTPFVGELARKGGATLAGNEDAERMLRRGELVGVWPEGFKGIGKPFSERYKLQRFGRGGFVSAALRVQVPIIPCSVVGAEEIYPLVGNIPSLARLLGVPYIPITPFFPLFGLLGLVPLPSKWLIEFGEPIRTDAYGAGAADDPMLVFNVTDQVRETIQQTMYSLLMQRRGVFS